MHLEITWKLFHLASHTRTLGLFRSKLGHNFYMDRLFVVHVCDSTRGHYIGIVAGYYLLVKSN